MGEHPLMGRFYRGTLDKITIFARLLKYEMKWGSTLDLSVKRRLWLWRRGFTSEADLLFDIDDGNHEQYLSTIQQERSTEIANSWTATASNKLVGHMLFSSFPEHLPELYGIVESGTLKRTSPLLDVPPWEQSPEATKAAPDGGGVSRSPAFEWIDTYLDEHSALLLKPVYGRAGNGVLVCRKGPESNTYDVNGETETRDEFVALVEGLEEYLAMEYVTQAGYADQLYAESTNTLRIMTFWDYEKDEPFVGPVIQRIGTTHSAPTDNWSNGGLSAELDEDGTMSSGVQWLSEEGDVRWFDTHPVSGQQIAGAQVPNWDGIREQVLELASIYPYLPKIGWDVLPTGDGEFKILELNPRAGTRSLQIHSPLLEDPRIREFYDHHDCL